MLKYYVIYDKKSGLGFLSKGTNGISSKGLSRVRVTPIFVKGSCEMSQKSIVTIRDLEKQASYLNRSRGSGHDFKVYRLGSSACPIILYTYPYKGQKYLNTAMFSAKIPEFPKASGRINSKLPNYSQDLSEKFEC